ncbi:MAG: 16S rRNA (cytosine(1402)-N(4))-methyltransferase [Candidatus Woykebacteria bacterium RBG_13_40_15]|uniref:Ribosomal RNA small subunit methyltransferase H n=1 Tax=Candidatus Woykebacteria bacterium RBG_13_40_15 TaxID=1802593 RepID=A0A1G1W9N5_9BACT|nr:MAG: 16S rRNA (cytosine(1402)-N(4))-methyltransferase [Candidatus Woykebacteria bacterium RBG_13_40_15]
MNQIDKVKFEHTPVMPKEVLELLSPKPGGVYMDATIGSGGHAKLILEKIGEKGRLIGMDQDSQALEAAKENLSFAENQVTFVKGNFRDLGKIFDNLKIEKVDGILLDLGVSSYQLTSPSRGFSSSEKEENLNARLDMRMDQESPFSAFDVVNNYPEAKLREIFFRYGEEPFSTKIAQQIVKERTIKPIETTNDLLSIIRTATPPKYRFSQPKGQYASNVFRAIRMEVNQELQALEEMVPQAINRLNSGSRLVVITFHSLEDRIVKHAFREATQPANFREQPTVKLLTKKPLFPTNEETSSNPRSQSAKIRAIEKL